MVEKENSSELPLDTNSGQISNFVNLTPGSQDRRLKYHADLDIGIMKQMQKNAEFRARMNVITKKCKKNLYPQVFVE